MNGHPYTAISPPPPPSRWASDPRHLGDVCRPLHTCASHLRVHTHAQTTERCGRAGTAERLLAAGIGRDPAGQCPDLRGFFLVGLRRFRRLFLGMLRQPHPLWIWWRRRLSAQLSLVTNGSPDLRVDALAETWNQHYLAAEWPWRCTAFAEARPGASAHLCQRHHTANGLGCWLGVVPVGVCVGVLGLPQLVLWPAAA